jgi:hypothetical protein
MLIMARNILIAILLLLGSTTASYAQRVLEPVERGLELPLQEITLPAESGGTVQFRACGTCSLATHTVTEETEYVFDHRELALADFLAAVEEIREQPTVHRRTIAGVYLDLETERVTRIVVVAPSSPQRTTR